jgi:hypothetical protein
MSQLSFQIKKAMLTKIDVRLVIMIASLAMFVLGAGAPSAGGGCGGG